MPDRTLKRSQWETMTHGDREASRYLEEMADEVAEHSVAIAAQAALILTGTGDPEGVVTAGVGSIFLRSDGGTSTTLYVKETGAGDTGWVAK